MTTSSISIVVDLLSTLEQLWDQTGSTALVCAEPRRFLFGRVAPWSRQAKVMHVNAAFAGTRVAAIWRVTRLHTATHVHG